MSEGLSSNPKSKKEIAKYRRAKGKFIAEHFDDYFGEDTLLQNWQKLCRDLGLQENLPSITKCRKVSVSLWLHAWQMNNDSRL